MPLFDWSARDALTRIRREYLAAGQRVEMEQHALAVSFGAMAAGAAVDRELTIPKEADFVWVGTAVRPYSDQASSGGTGGLELCAFNLRVTVHPPSRTLGTHRDAGAGGFVPILNIAGRGRMPFLWPVPLVLGAAALVTFELRNRGAVTQTPHLALLGVRMRRYSGAAA